MDIKSGFTSSDDDLQREAEQRRFAKLEDSQARIDSAVRETLTEFIEATLQLPVEITLCGNAETANGVLWRVMCQSF
jgi:hypothetical protein